MARDNNDSDQQLSNLRDAPRPREQADRFFIDLLTYGRVTHGLVTHDGTIKWLDFDWPLDIAEPPHVYDFVGTIAGIHEFADVGEDLGEEDQDEDRPPFTTFWDKYLGKNAVVTGNVIRFVQRRDACQDALARGAITVAEYERATLEDPERTYGATTDALRGCLSVPLTPDEKLAALDDIKAEIIKADFPTHEHEMKCIEAKHRLSTIVLADEEALSIDAISGVLEALRRQYGEQGRLPRFNQVDGVTDQQFLDVLQAHVDGRDASAIASKVGISPELVVIVLENIA